MEARTIENRKEICQSVNQTFDGRITCIVLFACLLNPLAGMAGDVSGRFRGHFA